MASRDETLKVAISCLTMGHSFSTGVMLWDDAARLPSIHLQGKEIAIHLFGDHFLHAVKVIKTLVVRCKCDNLERVGGVGAFDFQQIIHHQEGSVAYLFVKI